MMAMTSLALENVTKRFGDHTVLDNISIAFEPARITAIIGPSGCGKSTLLKMLNGLATPDSGKVLLFDRTLDYSVLPQLRRRLGYAVQGNVLFPHLSVKDNITLLARLERWTESDIQQRLQELLALTELDLDLLDRHPHQLSGGQQQRVGLCRAMVLRPEVLLLDEPFAAVDPITRRDIHKRLLKLHGAEPRTTLLVTHDMREALRLADRLLVMRDGKALYHEECAKLIAHAPDTDPETLLQGLLSGEAS